MREVLARAITEHAMCSVRQQKGRRVLILEKLPNGNSVVNDMRA